MDADQPPRHLNQPMRKAAAMTPMRGETVLLVDDDPIARLLTTAALTERGWRVIEVESGAQALEQFTREIPLVVVLDALMPGMDGFAVCERLRRLPGGQHVPVLMLTGLDDDASIVHAYEAGATDFFVKTSNQWTLLSERLRYMLRAARLREELAQSQATLTKAQRIAGLGSWSWDRHQRRFHLSKECSAILGLPYQEEGCNDKVVWARLHPDERTQVRACYRDVRRSRALGAGKSLNVESRIQRPQGEVRVVRVEAEIDRNENGRTRGLRGVMQDVTERHQSEEQIHQLANYDTLTGLPNRRFFRDLFSSSLEQARHGGTSVAVLYLDLDRFKQINDTLGHQMGDQVLREIGRRLAHAAQECALGSQTPESARETRMPPQLASPNRVLAGGGASAVATTQVSVVASVARLGGDEFTVLLTHITDTQAIEKMALHLLEALRQPVQVNEHEVFVSGSLGAALYPSDGADADTLIRKADIAMYAVKDEGRNGWRMFNTSMNTATADRWRVESALHRAIERNELVLEYQPKVNVATGEIVGAEALMRWHHEGRLVPPSAFISIAEESGLIVPITEWAINEVCDQLRQWQQMQVPLVPISVNISSRHIQRANLLHPVQNALARTQVAAQWIELELTETVLMHNLGAALPLLQSLKQLGLTLSIDDFGTGYSSLAYLKRLPLDTLKIDRSFVRDLEAPQGSDGAAIVAAIIAMSKSLKLRVVAEGVETRGQMQRLFEQGCQLMQGWLFAKSLSHERFVRMLVEQRSNPAWQVQFESVPPMPVSAAAPKASTTPAVARTAHTARPPLSTAHGALPQTGLPQIGLPQAGTLPRAPGAATQSHSNGTHFGAPAQPPRTLQPQPQSKRAAAKPQPATPESPNHATPEGAPTAGERARHWASRFLGRER